MPVAASGNGTTLLTDGRPNQWEMCPPSLGASDATPPPSSPRTPRNTAWFACVAECGWPLITYVSSTPNARRVASSPTAMLDQS